MTSNIKSNGLDLDFIFAPIGANSKIANVNIYSAGSDLSYKYAPLTLGSGAGTTLFDKSGTDIGTLFAPRAEGLYGWGNPWNSIGSLVLYSGASLIANESTLSTPLKVWTSISSSSINTAAIRSDGALFIWGSNSGGQLGLPPYISSRSSPVVVGSASWTSISSSATSLQTAGIKSDGSLWVWGDNTYGQLGSQISTTTSPVELTTVTTMSWTVISCGRNESFNAAIRSDGALFTWGESTIGESGNGSNSYSSPTRVGTSSWTSVSAGAGYILAIRVDGSLFGWGDNRFGQYGDGTVVSRNSPIQIGTSSWSIVSAGGSHTMAIRTDGALFTWGNNGLGQLGDGTTVSKSSPVLIGTSSWTAVSCGNFNTIAIRTDGALFTWGDNSSGTLGDGTVVSKSSPVQIGTSSWVSVSARDNHSAALLYGGGSNLFTWGDNTYGQLGDGTTISRSSPVLIGTSSWTSVSVGLSHTSALLSDKTLWSWGYNGNNQIGNGSLANLSSPVQIGTSSWTSVSASGFTNSIAIRIDGKLFNWGILNGFDYTTTKNYSPVQIGTSSWISVASGTNWVMAIRVGGSLFAWGDNGYGQLGDGTTVAKYSPVQIGTSSWTFIDASDANSTGIRTDGALFTWGNNTYGQLGDGTVVNKNSPVQIGTSSWSSVSAGSSFMAGLLTGGTSNLFTWGYNSYGQLGDGTVVNKSSPVPIGTSSWSSVSSGDSHIGAIRSDGGLFTWGYNTYGELGLGNTIYRSSPVQVGTSSWVSVNCGRFATCAILIDGSLFTWGDNTYGQLGDSTPVGRMSPVQIGTSSWVSVSAGNGMAAALLYGGGSNLFTWGDNSNSNGGWQNTGTASSTSPIQIGTSSWSMVDVGGSSIMAIRTDGTLFTWGDNTYGQLGDGTTVAKSSPVLIGTSSWSSVSAGGLYSAAIRTDGALFTWGYNTYGQLGDGTTVAKSSPVLIGTSSWVSVNCSIGSHILALRYGGGSNLFTWGYNINGQLGDGTIVNKSSPVLIGTSSWTSVSGGSLHSAAIRSDKTIYTLGSNLSGQLGYPRLNDQWLDYGLAPSFYYPTTISQSSWTAVSVGLNHSIGILSNGTLWAWGDNSYGQCGSLPSNYSPTLIPSVSTTSWTQISVRNSHVAAIRSDGALFTWGNNTYGQIGDGTVVNKNSPVQIGTSSWVAVSTGNSHTVGLLYGGGSNLYVWGYNTSGQLGDGTVVNKSSPVLIGTSSWSSVSAGDSHTSAILSDGTLWSWGNNTYGQLGIFQLVNRPYPMWTTTTSWVSVAVGMNHILSVKSDGSLWAVGDNTYGQLGDGTTVAKYSPIQIGTSSWAIVGAGYYHSAAIRIDGALFTWGYNINGQLGDGTIVNKSSPVHIGTSSWTAVTGGQAHTILTLTGGKLFGTGNNTYGQIGDGTLVSKSTPVSIGLSAWSRVAAGAFHTVAIRSDSALFTWGYNNNGQLGDGSVVNKSSPVPIGTSSWTWVSAGVSHSAAIRKGGVASGTLFTWGNNSYNQLVDGTGVNKSSPVATGGATSWYTCSCGAFNTLVASTGGSIAGGGLSQFGELGEAPGGIVTTSQYAATQAISAIASLGIVGNQPFIFSCGNNSVILASGANNFYAWGDNSFGQLGLNTGAGQLKIGPNPTNVSSPVQIGSALGGSWTSVSCGASHSAAINSAGILHTWGYNTGGQLGQLNSANNRPMIGAISVSSWTSVSAGANNTAAIRIDKNLFIVGDNTSGQLGDGTTVAKSSPVLIGTSSWTSVSVVGRQTAAIRIDGVLFTWGDNTYGQLGDNAGGYYSSPVQVGTSSWAFVSSGYTNTLGILNTNPGFLYSWGSGNFSYYSTLGFSPPNFISSPVQIGTSSWVSVSAGTQYSMAIRYGGGANLFGAGTNYTGQLGDGTYNGKVSFTAIGTSSWTMVSASLNGISSVADISGHTAAIRSDKGLFSWGNNAIGQIGDGTVVNKNSPVQIGTSSWTMVNASYLGSTGAILVDGGLYTWGDNNFSQLGDGTAVAKSSPVLISGGNSWTAVNMGATSLAIRTDGGMFGWGLNYNSQALGNGTHSTTLINVPTQIGTSSWTAVSTSSFAPNNANTENACLAVRYDGALFFWGYTFAGKYANGSIGGAAVLYSPVQIGTSSWSSITSGIYCVAGIRSDKTMWNWGANSVTTLSSSTPPFTQLLGRSVANTTSYSTNWLPVGSSSWVAVSCSSLGTFAIRTDYNLFGWGNNSNGELGDGTAVSKSSPVLIGTSSWTAVSGTGGNITGLKSY